MKQSSCAVSTVLSTTELVKALKHSSYNLNVVFFLPCFVGLSVFTLLPASKEVYCLLDQQRCILTKNIKF